MMDCKKEFPSNLPAPLIVCLRFLRCAVRIFRVIVAYGKPGIGARYERAGRIRLGADHDGSKAPFGIGRVVVFFGKQGHGGQALAERHLIPWVVRIVLCGNLEPCPLHGSDRTGVESGGLRSARKRGNAIHAIVGSRSGQPKLPHVAAPGVVGTDDGDVGRFPCLYFFENIIAQFSELSLAFLWNLSELIFERRTVFREFFVELVFVHQIDWLIAMIE